MLDNLFSSGGCSKIFYFTGATSTTSLFVGSPKNKAMIHTKDELKAKATVVEIHGKVGVIICRNPC